MSIKILVTGSNGLLGQKITDFYFCYYENAIDFDFSAFIKLSNNYKAL